jgi:formiminotetrahydrofolate cyclodeaminase
MRPYTDLPVRVLLDAFASKTPAPGGGSAAALAGATGVSLLLMAVGIPLSKPGDSGPLTVLAQAGDRLRSLQPVIAALIDRDADAYSAVVAALRMPHDPGNLDEPRRDAYDAALRGATDVPMETMRACSEALRQAPTVAAHCTKSTRGDVAVAIELLGAAVRGAGHTVDANLGSLKDAEYVSLIRSERRRLESESAADAEYGLSELVKGSALDIPAKPSTR